MDGRRSRPHTGRRRNEAARQAILDATFRLLREDSPSSLTIEAVAEAAGVGKQTIYRWWPSKGAVIAETLTEMARAGAATPDTGDIRADLTELLADTFGAVSDPTNARMLRRLMARAQDDPILETAVADFTAARRQQLAAILERARERGELPVDANVALLVDMAYGFLWYRLLIGHAPLNSSAAADLATALLAAATAEVPSLDDPGL